MYTVLQRQYFLKYCYGYYNGALDGKNGKYTKIAVGKFQRGFGLKPDQIWGPKTDAKARYVTADLQRLLNKHGANIKVDGILGAKTAAAIKEFQKEHGLVADGIAGTKTWAKLRGGAASTPPSSSGKLSAHFSKSEFRCQCGGRYCNGYPADISPKLINILERLRAYFGKPIKITSGLRCSRHNANVNGASNSKHKYGKAADIYIAGVSRAEIKRKAYEYGAVYCYYGTPNMGSAVHINV